MKWCVLPKSSPVFLLSCLPACSQRQGLPQGAPAAEITPCMIPSPNVLVNFEAVQMLPETVPVCGGLCFQLALEWVGRERQGQTLERWAVSATEMNKAPPVICGAFSWGL